LAGVLPSPVKVRSPQEAAPVYRQM
jgi:hypothetical protein